MRQTRLLLGTCLAGYLASLDNTVVAVALRDVQSSLGAGVTGLQGVVTGYVVALAALLPVGGALADATGRRRVLLTGLALFGAASAACALAPAVGWLVAARCVQGAGAALLLPGSLALLAAGFAGRQERARAVGVWAACGGLALVAGPLTGGLLVQLAGWRAVFWVNLPVCAAAGLLVAGRTGEPPPRRAGGGARRAAASHGLAAGALGAATVAVVLAGRDGPRLPVVTWGGVAVGLAVLLGALERRAAERAFPLLGSGDRRLVGAAGAAFAASLALFVLLVFVSLYLQLVGDDGALSAGVRLLPLTAAAVVVAPVAARVAARRGPRLPVTAGLGLCAAGLLGVAGALAHGPWPLELLLALAGAGVGLTGAPVIAVALDAVSRNREGLAAAAVNVARELGGVVAIAGLGSVVVARLTTDLTGRLRQLGTGPGPARMVVDLVLRGTTSEREVLRRTHGTVPLDALLQLPGAARASFLGSTRLALDGAGLLVVGGAVLAWLTLPGGRSPRGRARPGA